MEGCLEGDTDKVVTSTRLFEEAGASPGGTFPSFHPTFQAQRAKQPETQPAPPEPIDYLSIVSAFMPVLEALLSRKESARSEERVERFRAYVLAAMATGSSYDGPGGNRTPDQRSSNPSLYVRLGFPLSYGAIRQFEASPRRGLPSTRRSISQTSFWQRRTPPA